MSFITPEGESNELVAVDLRTGENVWTTLTEPGYLVWQVVAVVDGTVLAVAQEDGGPGQSIMSVDLATGEVQGTRDHRRAVPRWGVGGHGGTGPLRVRVRRRPGLRRGLRPPPRGEGASWIAFSVG